MNQVDQVDQISVESNDLRRPVAVVRVAWSMDMAEGVRIEVAEGVESVLNGEARLVDGLWNGRG